MRYIDLIEKTFDFPTPIFKVENNELYFNDVNLMDILHQYGTPIRLTYLPKIGEQIEKARSLFKTAIEKNGYENDYTYFYCTKSSHFCFVLEEVIKHGAQIETSSAYDLEIVKKLYQEGKITNQHYVISNGFKKEIYKKGLVDLIGNGFENCIPILDNADELDAYEHIGKPIQVGIRVAADEKPDFSFYTSRLGLRYGDIVEFYKTKLHNNPKFKLKMLHFFINSGIKDTAYYWSELNRLVTKYCELKKICPDLDTIDIGGGMPIQTSLHFDYNYAHMINEIVRTIKYVCGKNFVPMPHIFTEFGSYTVGESGAHIFAIEGQKLQNERELWYMIDGSFITHLPDTWGIGQKFVMLPVNHWDMEAKQVNLGGMTCDSDDYYNTQAYTLNIYMPEIDEIKDKQYVGFFHTGAYQESLGGYGGIQHCLIPSAKHVLISKDEGGNIQTKLFAEEQSSEAMLQLLGYQM
jgi:arginine decarboxylase